ncbi:unnamed protein product [Chrysodeixis includens]|uniref:Uncharacterized protein n=1 Tax=Chrysodeixis includens TaxID=689277 RepID=A0A9N8KWU3_CHRIL|nr:unnamed protein product [Chrysodeixis includens]
MKMVNVPVIIMVAILEINNIVKILAWLWNIGQWLFGECCVLCGTGVERALTVWAGNVGAIRTLTLFGFDNGYHIDVCKLPKSRVTSPATVTKIVHVNEHCKLDAALDTVCEITPSNGKETSEIINL